MRIQNYTWKKSSLLGLSALLTTFISSGIGGSSQVIRCDHSQLPLVDYSKQFETKSFGGFDREFTSKEFQTKILHLPDFLGNLKPLPMTEWEAPKTDSYSKSIETRDFEVMKIATESSREAPIGNEISSYLKGKSDSQFQKENEWSSRTVETYEMEPPKIIASEELKQLINRGIVSRDTEFSFVRVGRGFKAQLLGNPMGELQKLSQPKSESLQ